MLESRLAINRNIGGRRISQEELAKAIGASRNWVALAEKGKIGKSGELVVRLAHYLNRDIREIFLLRPSRITDKAGGTNRGET